MTRDGLYMLLMHTRSRHETIIYHYLTLQTSTTHVTCTVMISVYSYDFICMVFYARDCSWHLMTLVTVYACIASASRSTWRRASNSYPPMVLLRTQVIARTARSVAPILQFKGKITLKDFRERGVKFCLARHAKEKDQFGVKVWNDLNKVWAGMGWPTLTM